MGEADEEVDELVDNAVGQTVLLEEERVMRTLSLLPASEIEDIIKQREASSSAEIDSKSSITLVWVRVRARVRVRG